MAHSQALCGSLQSEAAFLPSVASAAGLQRACRKPQRDLTGNKENRRPFSLL